MSGKRNVSVCGGHELANALYTERLWRLDLHPQSYNGRNALSSNLVPFPSMQAGWRYFLLNFLDSLLALPFSTFVNCAPVFNHKIGSAARSGVSEDVFFAESHKWKKPRRKKWVPGRLLRETMYFWIYPTVRQFQDGWPTDPITTEKCDPTTFWLFSNIPLQQFLRWKFRNLFAE